MKIRFYLEYAAIRTLLIICRFLPEACVYALFRGIGRMACYLLPRRRITARLNTELAFPEKSSLQRRQIVRRHFINTAESLALNTMILSGRISNAELLNMVEVDHWERFEKAVKNSPKGALLFSGHIGNWELMSQYTALRLGITSNIITRQTNNPLIEKKIIIPLRERFGIKVFYKKNALRAIVHATRKGEPAGMLIDQRLNPRQGIVSNFFGHPAGMTATPAVLQIRFGIVPVPIFMIHSGRRRYKLIIREPVIWEDNGKPMEEQVAELTAIHQKIIEDIIREYPDQWFWVHDRWKLWKKRKH